MCHDKDRESTGLVRIPVGQLCKEKGDEDKHIIRGSMVLKVNCKFVFLINSCTSKVG